MDFESNLAAHCGLGGKQVYLARVRNPAFRQLLLELRPDLYAEGAKSNGAAALSAQEALKRIKQVGRSVPGSAIGKYEANLGAQLGRSGGWLARLRAKDAKVRALLHRLRPDLYVRPAGIKGPKFPLEKFLKCVEEHGATTPGATLFEYENNLARLIGRDGRRVSDLRRANPEVAKLLARCRPALYADVRPGRKRRRDDGA